MTAPPTDTRANTEQSLASLTARAARLWGGRVAWRFDECQRALTFSDVDERSNAIGHVLRSLGIQPGERVAVMLRNLPEFPLTWLALAKIRAVIVPVNIYYKRVDAHYLLEHSGAAAVVTADEFLPLINELRPELPELRHIVSVDSESSSQAWALKELLAHAPSSSAEIHAVPEQLVNIQYTSGTTGKPKGCMLSQAFWITMVRHLVEAYPHLDEEDVLLTAQPYYYIDPQWNTVAALLSGAELIVLDRFHPSTFWSKIRQYGATFFYCLGLMPRLLSQTPVDPDDRNHNVRLICCSGIPTSLHSALEERWGTPWHEIFGMTESGADIQVTPEEHDELVGSGCIGRPQPHREPRIVGEDSRPLPRGEIGELVLRGIGMMDGYFKDPGSTAAVFRDGWLHTGDLARMDTAGRVYYAGRKKDMIRRSGENISSDEIEEVLRSHPAVQVAGVVGLPDSLRGEEVKAYVVLAERHTVEDTSPDELIQFCSARLAYFKVPRYWTYREDLPRTASERIAKGELRAEEDDIGIGTYDRQEGVWR